jgi:hypothetical protein
MKSAAPTYSTTRRRLFKQVADVIVQEEARIANDYQKQHPDMSRSEALRLAAKHLRRDKYG